jgi:hypothetical protein
MPSERRERSSIAPEHNSRELTEPIISHHHRITDCIVGATDKFRLNENDFAVVKINLLVSLGGS